MKCLGSFKSMTLVSGMLMAACTGGGGTTAPDDKMEAPKADSLKRNPLMPLSCARPLSENPSASQLNRLTNEQFTNTLRDLFKDLVPDKTMPQSSDIPDELREGATFSNSVLSQAGSDAATRAREAMAISISGEAAKDLPKLMGCQAKDMGAESGCVDTFLEGFGTKAWRRPLSNDERSAIKTLFSDARKELDFATSMKVVVGGMLQAPQFLYRVQEGTGDAVKDLGKRLSDYEMASSLSYTLWNTMPDADLFGMARKGELSTSAQIEKQALKMLEDPRAKATVKQFQREWLHVSRLEPLASANAKDKAKFPNYSAEQANASLAGFERFLEDSFWGGDGSLKNVFTSTKGFVNDDSAELFGVSKPGSKDLVSVDLDAKERKGVLTQPFFNAGWANDKWQSAILRGAFVMESILCSKSPPPPPGTITVLKDVADRNSVTQRQVVEMTVEQGTCANCHKTIDAFGFMFDNYDAIGTYQAKERDLDLNTSAEISSDFDVKGKFTNGIEFTEALANSEQVAQCFVQHMYEFVTARPPEEEDGCLVAPLTDTFLAEGTDMKKLMLNVVKSPAFRYRSAAQ